jgi:DNA-binding XRE family transcriptional regulator
MIRNDREYREAVERIEQERQRLETQRAELERMGLDESQIKRAMDPMRSFHAQLVEEVGGYERLKRGQFDEIPNLRGLGPLLVALRIARGLTQRQLAQRLGVHETQVSRDERNEYHGVTLQRAGRILDALNARVRSTVELPDTSETSVA